MPLAVDITVLLYNNLTAFVVGPAPFGWPRSVKPACCQLLEEVMGRFFVVAAVVCMTSICGVGPAAAQSVTSTSGAITGRVVDNTGGVLPGVTVTASSPAQMGTRTAVTGEDGSFRLPAVPPGEYRVVFETRRLHDARTIRHPGRPRIHRDGQRGTQARKPQRDGRCLGCVARGRRPCHGPDVVLLPGADQEPADHGRVLGAAVGHAGRADERRGRGRQPGADADGVHRLRHEHPAPPDG